MKPLSAFEQSIREALGFAQQRRKSIGLRPAETDARVKRDGTRLVGPDSYKLTIYLHPWHYADLIHHKNRRNLSYGLNKIIEKLIEDHIDHVAARPPKKPKKLKGATVVPIRKNVPTMPAVAAYAPKKRAAVG